MATAGSQASISLIITNQKTGEPVVYKQDGKRFTSDVTIKLSVNTVYVVSVTIKPAFSNLKGLELGTDMLTPDDTIRSEGTVKHSFTWSTTGIPPSGSAKRNSILVTLHFDPGILSHHLQTKFYKSADLQHVSWGTSLHAVELSCKIEQEGSAVGKITDCRIK
ncbi:hypothetical protein LOD99_14928 [Oopsacas minuta]|uniref:CB1 cannabinoid receptor-interacting protein 1 n=1 Tax=Oopsacas minuta TaxID=111878 RepID=A0AAV7KEH6_9METZ|nr:hypothetical protein LOD99_14928 [Oopsacas minuta]